MRKLELQVQISVDGFVATGPDDDQTWVTWAWDEIRDHVVEIFDRADTILLGRKLVNPVALGRGDPIFARAAAIRQLELIRAVPFPSGIVLLTYRPRLARAVLGRRPKRAILDRPAGRAWHPPCRRLRHRQVGRYPRPLAASASPRMTIAFGPTPWMASSSFFECAATCARVVMPWAESSRAAVLPIASGRSPTGRTSGVGVIVPPRVAPWTPG
jgi:hypothetical protein